MSHTSKTKSGRDLDKKKCEDTWITKMGRADFVMEEHEVFALPKELLSRPAEKKAIKRPLIKKPKVPGTKRSRDLDVSTYYFRT